LRWSYFRQVGPFDRYVKDERGFTSDTIHYDKGDKVADYSGWEPRIGMRYKLNKTSSLKAAYTRNYQYIHHYGLAYKRIGVFVFLAATLVGLVTLYFKITKKKSIYYLLGVNSWSVYGLLIVMSMVNWDMVIVNHNVNHPNQENIDVKFLLTLSDKTLPVIQEHRKQLKIDSHHIFWAPSEYSFILDKRIDKFKKRKEETTWRSWNYAEEQAIIALETKK
jgi:hypothetical protein